MTTHEPPPPSYDAVFNDDSDKKPLLDDHRNEQQQQQQGPSSSAAAPQQQPVQQAAMRVGASVPTRVYYYQDPATGQRITTFLPPDHPEMLCLQQGHVLKTNFGFLGVVAAVFWFPLGIALCMLDRRVRCTRCNRILEDGITC